MTETRLEALKDRALALSRRHGRETPVDGLFMAGTDTPTGPIHGVYQPSICVVLQGAKVSRLGGQSFRYGAGKCLITSLEVPVRAEIVEASAETPYIAIVMTIDPAVVADLLLELAHGDAQAAPVSNALSVAPLDEALIDPLERMLALAENPRGVPFAIVRGRMGGSAMTAAALNALARTGI